MSDESTELTDRERRWANQVVMAEQMRTELDKKLAATETELAAKVLLLDQYKAENDRAQDDLRVLNGRLDTIRAAQSREIQRVELLVGVGVPPKGTVVDVGEFGVVVNWDNGTQGQYLKFDCVRPIEE